MSIDVTKIQFYSGYPIDKIIQQGTATYTVAGVVSSTTPNYSTQSIPNNFGVKGFVILSWSVDGVNFQDQENALYFTSTFFGGKQILSAQAQGGSDSSNIYFFMKNGLSDNTPNPVSQIFTINYTLVSIS